MNISFILKHIAVSESRMQNVDEFFKIPDYKNVGLVAARFWLRLRDPKGGGSLCLSGIWPLEQKV